MAGSSPAMTKKAMGGRKLSHHHLKTKIGDEIPALVLDREGASQAFQRLPGVFIAECCGPLVIGFRSARILRPAAAFLGKRAHPLQRAGVILRRRLLEQTARADVVLGAAGTVGAKDD